MKRKVLAAILAILFVTSFQTHATTFTEDGSIDGGVYGDVHIINTATVDMTGGSVDTVSIEQMGTLNYYDGTIIDEIYVWNSGTFNLEGANFSPVQNLHVTNAGLFNMNTGTLSGTIELREYVEVNINDGQITNSLLDSMGYSTTNIYGGEHNFDDIWLNEFSTLNIYGGDVNWLTAGFSSNSVINIYGGSIYSEHGFNLQDDAEINVYYSSVIYQERPYQILGYYLLDGSEFMLDQFTQYEIDQINFIPEPSTLLLLSLGGLLLRKKR